MYANSGARERAFNLRNLFRWSTAQCRPRLLWYTFCGGKSNLIRDNSIKDKVTSKATWPKRLTCCKDQRDDRHSLQIYVKSKFIPDRGMSYFQKPDDAIAYCFVRTCCF